MQDSSLIKKCQNNDPKAQRRLFSEYYRYVYAIAYRYLQNHHDCEDIVSIIFNKVFRNINRVKQTENDGLKRWIQTISINESLRFIQRKNPILYTDNDVMLDKEEEVIEMDDSLRMDKIKKLIQQMPEGYRRVFLLHVVEGLTHSEIAEYLDISRNTSKSQMIKARKYLQTQLKNYESQEI